MGAPSGRVGRRLHEHEEMSGVIDRRADRTVEEFTAWHAANDKRPKPEAAATALADLFARARRGGGDLHDPTPELLRWLVRELARDPATDHELAILTLRAYLAFLSATRRWRRSEHVVRACWAVLDHARRRPRGLRSLGDLDQPLADRLACPTSDAQLLAAGLAAAFVTPMRRTLDALAASDGLSPDESAPLASVPPGSIADQIWLRGLAEAGLVTLEDSTVAATAVVTDAGGCPPPSAELIESVVSGLVRAALFRACEEGEDTGLAVVRQLVTDPPAHERHDAGTAHQVVEALARFGLLDPAAGSAVRAPFQPLAALAVADVTGCVGTADEQIDWQPVELPYPLRADTALDLVLTLEQAPGVWRRLRVAAVGSLELLHRELQGSLGWRDVRPSMFCDAGGTHRFAPPWLLKDLTAQADAAVTDSTAVRLGSVLSQAGDELTYLYGSLANPWRVRVVVERVTSGIREPVTRLDGGGDAPIEPSLLAEALTPRLPAGASIPAELERAWVFMEERRWIGTAPAGHPLAAPGPPAARPGIVFDAGLDLPERPAEEGEPMAALVPIAASPDGTVIALRWAADGAPRVLGLAPDGTSFPIAASVADLLRLAAIGYPDLSRETLRLPPRDADAVAGVAEFRDWVRGRLGLAVPDRWVVDDDGRFAA